MTTLSLVAVADDGFGPLTLNLEAGLSVLLADSSPSVGRLVEIAAGVRRPRAGRVSVDGVELAAPSHRRRVAAVLADEELIPEASVRRSVRGALSLRGIEADADRVLAAAGLEQLAARRPDRLDAAERRAVALSLALADTRARAVILHDPLATSPLVARDFVLETCAERARSAAVLVATSQLEDAIAFGGSTWLLQAGKLAPSGVLARAADQPAELWVRAPEARRLAALLAEDPAVAAVLFDEQRGRSELIVRGADLEALALGVLRVAAERGIPIEALVPRVPPLSAAGAARSS